MSTCNTCANCRPEQTEPRLLRVGFARCSQRPTPGRFVSADARQPCFTPMAPGQAQARKAALAQHLAQHQNKEPDNGHH